jgi:hypothetical protein
MANDYRRALLNRRLEDHPTKRVLNDARTAELVRAAIAGMHEAAAGYRALGTVPPWMADPGRHLGTLAGILAEALLQRDWDEVARALVVAQIARQRLFVGKKPDPRGVDEAVLSGWADVLAPLLTRLAEKEQ